MNNNSPSVGYLTVNVSTARGAIPLEGAIVNIRTDEQDSSEILFSLSSDRDGKTPKVTLPTPAIENSEAPGGDIAFSSYNIDVFKNGYTPLYFHNVPIFPSVHSIQSAVMVPRDLASPYDSSQNIEEAPQSSLE